MKNIIALFVTLLCSCINSFAQESKTDLYADNIVIVFDASGSMADPISSNDRSVKLNVAKYSLKQVVSGMKDNTNIGLFVFGNVTNNNPVPIGPKNLSNLVYAIEGIQPGGGTPLGEFIEKAANQLLQQRQKNLGYGRYKILVVTDGEATDVGKMQEVAPEVLKRNLSLDVIGVGMTKEHQLAKMSTSYRAANDAESLNKALQEIVAETPAMTQSNAGNDDFETIKWLSNEQANAVILTLGNNENQPLFQKATSNENVSATNQNIDPGTAAVVGGSCFFLPIVFIVVVFVLFIVKAMLD